MALENDNGNGLNVSMPVQPMYSNGGNYGGGYGGYGFPMMGYPVMPMMGGFGGGFGNMFGGDGAWILLLLLLCGGGWGGLGGMLGGFGLGGWGMMDGAFPWLLASNANNQNATNAGFDNLGLTSALSGIQSAVTSGNGDTQLGLANLSRQVCETGGDIQNSLCNGFAGVNANISNTAAQGEIAAQGRHSALTQQLYNNELNSLNRSFAEQTANTAGLNAIQNQLADCCCENRLAVQGLGNTIVSEACADRAAISDGIRDVLTATQAQNQRILDKLCDQELQAERRENQELRTRLSMADLAASQTAQTARLLADNAAQTQQIENYVRPQINPAYIVPNPYAYNFYPNNGWNGGCGGNWNGNFGGNPFGNVGFGNGSF